MRKVIYVKNGSVAFSPFFYFHTSFIDSLIDSAGLAEIFLAVADARLDRRRSGLPSGWAH